MCIMDDLAFSTRHIGPQADDYGAMLETLGTASPETLIAEAVPRTIRLEKPLDLPPAATEREALDELKVIMAQNRVLKSFIGRGITALLYRRSFSATCLKTRQGTRPIHLIRPKSARSDWSFCFIFRHWWPS